MRMSAPLAVDKRVVEKACKRIWNAQCSALNVESGEWLSWGNPSRLARPVPRRGRLTPSRLGGKSKRPEAPCGLQTAATHMGPGRRPGFAPSPIPGTSRPNNGQPFCTHACHSHVRNMQEDVPKCGRWRRWIVDNGGTL